MEVKVRCLGGRKFEMLARGHQVISDQPCHNDGTDTAMTPPELFLSSLGACAAYYAKEYLQVRGLPDEGLEIHVSAQKGDKPARIVKVRMEVIAPGLNQRHRDGILRAVDACLLEKTLVKPPELDVKVISTPEVEQPEPVLA
jgi:putative redox protein